MTVHVKKGAESLRQEIERQHLATGAAGHRILASESAGDVARYLNLGRRNMLYNGNMNISQRYGTTAVTFNNEHILDRWRTAIGYGSGTRTAKQAAEGPPGFETCLLYQAGASGSIAANNWSTINQALEGQDIAPLKWGTPDAETITISFWVNVSHPGLYSLSVYNGDSGGFISSESASRSFVATYDIPYGGQWIYKEVTIPGDTTGSWTTTGNSSAFILWFELGSGSTYTATSNRMNEWLNGKFVRGSFQTDLSQYDYATFKLTGVQMEIGDRATPFEHRSFGEELSLCQRYFCKSYDYSTVPGTSTFNGCVGRHGTASSSMFSTGEVFVSTRFAVDMRAAPTVTAYDITGNAGKTTRTAFQVADYHNESITVQNASSSGCIFNSSSGTNAATLSQHYIADAEL